MHELLKIAAEEAAQHAAGLPGEPVAVVVMVFNEDGVCSPLVAGEIGTRAMVATRLMEVARSLADQMDPTRDGESAPPVTDADLAVAEQIANQAICKAMGH